MNQLYFIFVIAFLIIQNGHSQAISIRYEIDTRQAIQQLNEKIQTSVEPVGSGTILTKNAVELLGNFSYTLNINDSKSHFFLNPVMIPENEDITAAAMAEIMAEKGDFFQDIESDQILRQKKSFGEQFIIESRISDYEWELTSECKEINGYESYKAVTKIKDLERQGGYRYIDIAVWFTPEIPLSYGPEGFGGLPGLILEKCQGGICIKIKDITSKNTNINFPSGKRIDKENYFKFLEKVRDQKSR